MLVKMVGQSLWYSVLNKEHKMTAEQRDELVLSIHNKHESFNSCYSDVREAVSVVVEMLTDALEEMDCK